MRKGSTRKPQADEPATPVKNYITRSGLERLKDEHQFLLTRERPAVTEVVAWAASNGDRSENADYQYGKRRLRQIDGRIRFLTKRIEAAEVVDPEAPRAGQPATRAFFGATVRYANAAGVSRVVSIVGTDEIVAGAKGYVAETASPAEFVQAVRVVSQGSVWAPRHVFSMFIERENSSLGHIFPVGRTAFTDREKEVLELLVAGRSNKEIGSPLGIQERTVKAHVAKLLRKVGVQNRIALSVHALTHSLVNAK